MKVYKKEEKPARPDGIIELTPEEMDILRQISRYNVTVPEAIYRAGGTTAEISQTKMGCFLVKLQESIFDNYPLK
jgi:hypothetical protein